MICRNQPAQKTRRFIPNFLLLNQLCLHLVPDQLGALAFLLQLWAEGFHAVLEQLAATPNAQNLLVLQTWSWSLLMRTRWNTKTHVWAQRWITELALRYQHITEANDALHVFLKHKTTLINAFYSFKPRNRRFDTTQTNESGKSHTWEHGTIF